MENTKFGIKLADVNNAAIEAKEKWQKERNANREHILQNPEHLQNESTYPTRILQRSYENIGIEIRNADERNANIPSLKKLQELIKDELERRGQSLKYSFQV